MIEKTRRRFILYSMLALSLAMTIVILSVNLSIGVTTENELRDTLHFLSRFSGPPLQASMKNQKDPLENPPEVPPKDSPADPPNDSPKDSYKKNPPGNSEDSSADSSSENTRRRRGILSESRYFSVIVKDNGILSVSANQTRDETTDKELLQIAESTTNRTEGIHHSGVYLYECLWEDGSLRAMVFLNCEMKYESLHRLFFFSFVICLFCIGIALLIMIPITGHLVKPLTENISRMHRFITNTSHELKTPLTVISANMDVLSLDQPDNTWIHSTQKQVSQLRRMVDEMVYLTRMEEKDAPLSLRRFQLSALMKDAAEPFAAMAEFSGGTIEQDFKEDVFVNADESSIQRVATILLDNAVKYAPKGSTIHTRCYLKGRNAVMETENAVTQPLSSEQCERLFDRFYRADESRNKQEHSGYGIGLAIASAVAEKHSGHMEARMNDHNLIIRLIIPHV